MSDTPEIIHPPEEAWVIMLGDRYFSHISTEKRVITAWTLAGAKMYCDQFKLENDVTVLEILGRDQQVRLVRLVPDEPQTNPTT